MGLLHLSPLSAPQLGCEKTHAFTLQQYNLSLVSGCIWCVKIWGQREHTALFYCKKCKAESHIPWRAIKGSNIHSCDATGYLSHDHMHVPKSCNPETLHTNYITGHMKPHVPIDLKYCPWWASWSVMLFYHSRISGTWTSFPRAHFYAVAHFLFIVEDIFTYFSNAFETFWTPAGRPLDKKRKTFPFQKAAF